ncbi:MAG: tetratricopeptide repeat protein [Chloroflexi bacterium]|uniref:tetratricopeptide repeat protein n=1 Tax=Candidatus Flexifilum breve TaxID=3140694 RepID=UPI00313524D6|nr:tetratricopeptide repeat protein [Chloroflexota bacterium]
MATLVTRYLPADRVHALAAGTPLETTATGSALFADISGFTPITEKLRQALGARRGAETLASHLNRVYDALIAEVDRFGGSIISFAGDAITCWFAGDDAALHAAACAFALLEAMQTAAEIPLPNGETALLGLKVSLATGTTRRFVVGNPHIQQLDALAGATIARMASGEGEAERGEVVADVATVEALSTAARVRIWREAGGERFAVLEHSEAFAAVLPAMPFPTSSLDDALARSWLLPAVAAHFEAGLGEYLTELRPAVALFVRFTGIDYDHDPDAEANLDRFVRLVQRVVVRSEGSVLQLTIGDKGSYLYAAFGAPFAHEDDIIRALDAALEIRAEAAQLGYLDPLQIGISQGTMRTGAYGGETRRTYGVLGDEVNLAARLMAQAAPGEILLSETVAGARLAGFALEALAAVQVKGKARPIGLFRLLGRREGSFEARFYTTALVGREDELAVVQAAFQPLFAGRHAGIIYVNGEPGMGKSRLAFETQRRLQSEAPVTWLTGQADQLNRAPLSAFRYFLRPYFGQHREVDTARNLAAFETAFAGLMALSDDPNRADLLLYRSYLAGVVGLVIPDSPYAAADERLRIDNSLAAIKAWARAESQRQPLVLHLEDAQWFDPISLSAVQQLTYNMANVPVALLLTCRYQDDGSPYTISGIYSVPVHTVDLGRLNAEGGRAVAEAVLSSPVSEALARFLHERAEGNPFFTEQLTLDLKERGVLTQTNALWDIQLDTHVEVPSGVNSVLIARLDRLATQVKAAVQTAAVLGREFDVQILSLMLRESAQTYIQAAEGESIWTALDALRYLFRHALLRDAAYQMQVQERLQGLHRLAAEAIEALYPDDPAYQDALLEHWRSVGAAEKIIAYTVLVCQRILDVTAENARAERLLDQALAFEQTPALLRLRGDVATDAGDYAAATTHYTACLNANPDAAQHIQALLGLSRMAQLQSNYPVAQEHAQQALNLAQSQQNQLGIADSLRTLGLIAHRQSDQQTAVPATEESLRLYRALNHLNGVIDAVTKLGEIAIDRGDRAAGQRYLEEGLSYAEALGSRRRIAASLNTLGNNALLKGDYAAARGYYERSLSARREIGDRIGAATVLGNLAILESEVGNLDAAEAFAQTSLSERRALNNPRGVANSLGMLASIYAYRRQHDDAQRLWDEAVQMQRTINDRWGAATTLVNLAELAHLRGNDQEARRYGLESLELARQINQVGNIGFALAYLGSITSELQAWDEARGYFEEALTILRQINNQDDLGRALVNYGIMNSRIGNLLEAERQIEEGVAALRAIDERNLAWSLVTLAEVKQKLGQPQATIDGLLREALTVARAKSDTDAKFSALIGVATVFMAQARYSAVASVIGLLAAQQYPHANWVAANQLLTDLRARADVAVIEQDGALDVDGAIEQMLEKLERA